MEFRYCALAILLCAVLIFAQNYSKNIFKPWRKCHLSEIKSSDVPWTNDEFVPTIVEFRNKILKGLMEDPQVQKIWDSSPSSHTIRKVYFKLMNQVFSENGDTVPAALANIISKSASLFKHLDKKTYFTCDAVSIGQFLMAKNITVDADAAKGYVTAISKAIEVGSITLASTPEEEFEALIQGWENFFKPYNLNVDDYQNDLILLFTSHLIVLYDKRHISRKLLI